MPFRKIRGLVEEEIFETKITDGTGKILDKWKVLKKDFPSVVRILNDNYGLGMKFEKKDKDKDLSWAM